MKYTTLFGCSLAALLFGVPAVSGAEADPLPPPPPTAPQCAPAPENAPDRMGPPEKRGPGMRDMRRHDRDPLARLVPRGPMSEDDMAKFADLRKELMNAMEDFRTKPTDASRTAVKTALAKMFDAAGKYEVERCEKALARAKAKLEKKDQQVDRMFNRLTNPKPAPDARPGKDGFRKGPRGMKPAAPNAEQAPAPAPAPAPAED